jgi:hypothetical protein
MLSEDRDALICDMAETYHIYNMWALPVETVATLACGLREDSRIKLRLAGMEYIPPYMALIRIHDLLSAYLHSSKSGNPPVLLGNIAVAKKEEQPFGYESAEDLEAARARFIKN